MREIVVSLYAALACRYTDLNTNDCNRIDFWCPVGASFIVPSIGCIYSDCMFIQVLLAWFRCFRRACGTHALLLYGSGK